MSSMVPLSISLCEGGGCGNEGEGEGGGNEGAGNEGGVGNEGEGGGGNGVGGCDVSSTHSIGSGQDDRESLLSIASIVSF